MPLSEQRKAELTQSLPPAEETRKRLDAYMLAADLTRKSFGALIGYGADTLKAFMQDTYTTSAKVGRTDLAVREAIESYIARHPLNLGSTDGNGETLYETENVGEIRRWFHHCHAHRALAFIYGPPGSQKSFVMQQLIAEFNSRELSREDRIYRAYYIYVSINMRPRDLMRKICAEVGAPASPTLQGCMSSLRHHLRHTQTVVVLDEAQHATIDSLEAMRELHDADPRIGILLAGSHTLKQFFDQHAAELEQWNSRLDAGIELSGVSDATARAIFAAECPELDADQVEAMIEGSRVLDPYSAKRGHTYLSMRRLFKSISAVRRQLTRNGAAASPATDSAAEVLQ